MFLRKMEDKRKFTAILAKELYKGKITFDDFLLKVPDDENDEDISELIDLITHEPKRGGFMGVKKKEHDKYMANINDLINKLSL
jgi:hypothetical protein